MKKNKKFRKILLIIGILFLAGVGVPLPVFVPRKLRESETIEMIETKEEKTDIKQNPFKA